jgi:hypothetical protein
MLCKNNQYLLTVSIDTKYTYVTSYLPSTDAFFKKPVSQPFAHQAGARLKFRPHCNCLAHTRAAVLGSMWRWR